MYKDRKMGKDFVASDRSGCWIASVSRKNKYMEMSS